MKIVFTGGGTAGHVTPNLAIIESFQLDGVECFYIGSNAGIESTLVERHNLDFYGIASGKLRRYFDWQNFIDPVKILFGFFRHSGSCSGGDPMCCFPKADLLRCQWSLPPGASAFPS